MVEALSQPMQFHKTQSSAIVMLSSPMLEKSRGPTGAEVKWKMPKAMIPRKGVSSSANIQIDPCPTE